MSVNAQVRSNLFAKLVLTYDNSAFTDGAGAQLQRIYGTYALSRLLGTAYWHTGLGQVDYHGLSAYEANTHDPEFNSEFNDLFWIESDISSTEGLLEVRLRDISVELVDDLAKMVDRGDSAGRPILARVVLPYGIADRFPDCYEVCKDVSPFPLSAEVGRPLRVALHVRRGELFAIASDRLLPNSYYIAVALGVARTLEALGIDYQIELFTEVPTKPFAFRPDDKIFNAIRDPVVVDAEMCRVQDFDVLPHLIPRINGRAIDCLRELATADVLVMSRSSFSFVAAALNRRCVVLYHPFWHQVPSSWIPVDPDSHFDPLRLAEALKALTAPS